jgi:7-carboxy-7-deazaguanine synthase
LTLKVNEIFCSLQGESSYVGLRCVFIRLTGCNLRCSYCDTTYAYNEGADLSIDQILERTGTYGCRLVEITGGEPLVQAKTPELVSRFLGEGFTVLMETNGSLDIGRVGLRCIKIMDVKCPSSGEAEKNDLGNLGKLSEKDEVKFVIGTREDYEFAKGIVANQLESKTVLFSTVFGKLKPRNLAEWILEDRLNVRFQLQLHKYVWEPNQRGV